MRSYPIWVAPMSAAATGRRVRGGAAARRREAGAIFVGLNRLDGTASQPGPAPQAAFDDARLARRFARALPQPAPEAKIEERLTRELRFDPDVWIVEVEDRAGRHFDQIVARRLMENG